MARSYKDLAADVARRKVDNAIDRASAVADSIIYAPAKAAEAIQNIKPSVKKKADLVATNIEAKLMLGDYLMGDIDASTFAYHLASDTRLQKTMNQLAQQILQPTPVESRPSVTDNGFINLGAGLSAFWAEMQTKLPIEIESATEIENILMNLNAGLDPDMEPDTRKLFLKEAGLTSEQVKELVPLSEYMTYENRMKDAIRSQVLDEFGFKDPENLSEDDRALIDSVVEDRFFASKLPQGMGDDYYPTCEDIYGISAEDLFEMFEEYPDKNEQPFVGTWEEELETSGALAGYREILNATVDENLAMLHELEMEAKLSFSESEITKAEDEVSVSDEDFFQGFTEEDIQRAVELADDDPLQQ